MSNSATDHTATCHTRVLTRLLSILCQFHLLHNSLAGCCDSFMAGRYSLATSIDAINMYTMWKCNGQVTDNCTQMGNKDRLCNIM